MNDSLTTGFILAFGAIGVLISLPIMALAAFSGIFLPGLFGWLWLFPVSGFFAGLIYGGLIK